MEATFVRVIMPSVSLLPLVHSIFTASVPLDDADDDEQDEKESDCKHHADEPASGGDILLMHNNDAIRIVSTDLLDIAGHVVASVDGDHHEFVNLSAFQTWNKKLETLNKDCLTKIFQQGQ